jgi:predicted transcriptional regulator of viral defense system
MRFEDFVDIVRDLPVIATENLLAGVSGPESIEVQISRWQKAGKLIQLKRGIYVLSGSYRKNTVFEPYLASILKRPSYLSLEKALEYHNLIPEAVAVYTSVTPKRPGRFISKLGTFDYRHIKSSLFWGYESVTMNKQTAFIASPEKGLLDLLYLKQIKVSLEYLRGLRLQNVEKIDIDKLLKYAKRFKKPKVLYGAGLIKEYVDSYQKEEKEL